MNFADADDKIILKGSAAMTTVKKDALIAEITEICARFGRAEAELLSTEPAPFRNLFSPYQLADILLPNRCLIAPKTMVGGSFVPNDIARRFYLARAEAGLLTTGPLSTGRDSDPLLLQRWMSLNERLHAKGAHILLQLQPDGTVKHALSLASAGAAAGFDGVCIDARIQDDALTQIVREIRARLGSGFLILCRVSLSSAVPESGLNPKKNGRYRGLAEQLERMTELARAGADGLEVSIGCPETPWLLSPASQLPAGCFAEAARALKAHFRVLGIRSAVIASGRLSDPGLAEALLKKGYCDLVSLDGAGIGYPAWFRKAATGQEETICPCALPLYPLSPEKERIAVIGAGCRGLNYALQASDAGHSVDLYEERLRPGGDLALFPSSAAEVKKELLAYLLEELKKRPQIRLRTGTRADAELLKKGAYDRIVFACRPEAVSAPAVQGWGEIPFITAESLEEAFSGQWKKKRIVVLGSDDLSCDIAWALQNEGQVRRCVLLTERPTVMSGEPEEDRAWFMHHFRLRGGQMMTGKRISRIRFHTIFTEDPISGEEGHVRCDLIILAQCEPAPLRLYEEAVRERLAPQIQIL